MSKSINRITLLGNVGADPEIRTTSGGVKVAQFSLATGRKWRDAKGESQEKTEWHRVIAWNNPRGKGMQLADIVEQMVRKGAQCVVEGRVEYRQYTDREGGVKYVTEVLCQELTLTGGGGRSEVSRDGGGRTEARREPALAGTGARGDDDFPLEQDDNLPF